MISAPLLEKHFFLLLNLDSRLQAKIIVHCFTLSVYKLQCLWHNVVQLHAIQFKVFFHPLLLSNSLCFFFSVNFVFFCLFLSISVILCPFKSASVSFFLVQSVLLSFFSSFISFHFCLFMSFFVRLGLFLSILISLSLF